MSNDEQRPIDNLEEQFAEQSESIIAENNSNEDSEQTSSTDTPSLEDIRTAGL